MQQDVGLLLLDVGVAGRRGALAGGFLGGRGRNRHGEGGFQPLPDFGDLGFSGRRPDTAPKGVAAGTRRPAGMAQGLAEKGGQDQQGVDLAGRRRAAAAVARFGQARGQEPGGAGIARRRGAGGLVGVGAGPSPSGQDGRRER